MHRHGQLRSLSDELAEETELILRHGGVSILIAKDQKYVDKVLQSVVRLPNLRRIAAGSSSSTTATCSAIPTGRRAIG
jgi:hypothetical protein